MTQRMRWGYPPLQSANNWTLSKNTFGIRLLEKSGGRLVLTEDGELFHEDAMKAVGQALLAEEQVYAHQAIRNHHLVVGHSTHLPPRLIAAITQLRIEGDQPVHIDHEAV